MPDKSLSTSDGNPYSLDVYAVLLNAYKTRTGCDVEVKCGEESFSAHSFWLEWSIPYFATASGTAVRAGPGERDEAMEVGVSADPFDLRASPISEDALKLVLDMVYGLKTQITAENCIEIHRAANYLGLEELAGHCLDKICSSRCLSRVLEISEYANNEFSDAGRILEVCQNSVMSNVEEVSMHPGFRKFPLHCVVQILKREFVYDLPRAAKCFDLALRWILVAPQERSKHLKTLLSSICLTDMDFTPVLLSETYVRFMACPDVYTDTKTLLSSVLATASERHLDVLIDADRCREKEERGNVYLIASALVKTGSTRSKLKMLKLSADLKSWQPLTYRPVVTGLPNDVVMAATSPVGTNMLLFWIRNPNTNTHDLLGCDTELGVDLAEDLWPYRGSEGIFGLYQPVHILAVGMKVCNGRVHMWAFVNGERSVYGVHYADLDPYCMLESDVRFSYHELNDDFSGCAHVHSYRHTLWDEDHSPLLSKGIFRPSRALCKPLFDHDFPGVTTYKGKLYLAGGEEEGQSRVEYFDPEEDAWFELPSLPRSHQDIHLVAARQKLFVLNKKGPDRNVDWLDLGNPQAGWNQGPSIPSSFFTSEDDEFSVVSN